MPDFFEDEIPELPIPAAPRILTRENLLEMIAEHKTLRAMALDLSANGIEELPSEIGGLGELIHLNLSGNALAEVPLEIGQLKGLRSLSLGSNRLKTLPVELGNLTELRYLDLSYNDIVSLPPDLHRLKHLTQLRLENNQVAVGTPVDPAPPARIRTCRIAACGSYRGCLASKRKLG